MKSPLTDTYHRYGWSQAYGDLGLNSPFFMFSRIENAPKSVNTKNHHFGSKDKFIAYNFGSN